MVRRKILYIFFIVVGLIVLGTNVYLVSILLTAQRPAVHGALHHHHRDTAIHDHRAPEGTRPKHHALTGGGGHHHHHANISKPPKRRDVLKHAIREKRAAFQVPAEGYSPLNYTAALQLYEQYMTPTLDIEQSSNRFEDFTEEANAGVLLPDEPIVSYDDEKLTAGESCDPRDSRFSDVSDAACRAYLADPRSWRSVKPMSSILSTGRTIKFKVYLSNGAAAVMKVSQKKFALEPAAELMAFYVDRLLGFKRVPPVEWVQFPVDYLKAACATKGAFYSQWFERFVLQYSPSKNLLHSDPASGGTVKVLFVSLQLWMHNVHDAEDTILNPPSSYRKMLDAASGPLPDDNITRTALAELSDMALFDFVIGNTDRWEGHNSFVLGECVRGKCATAATNNQTMGPPKYAFIDQGSSFYRNGLPEHNLYNKGNETESSTKLCRFRPQTVSRLRAMAGSFDAQLMSHVPRGLLNLISRSLLHSAGNRLVKLTHMFDSCEARFPDDAARALL